VTDWQWLLIDFFQALAAGLLVGGTYGLMCVGLGIIFGVMRVVNFAQGDFMMLGMYVAYYLVTGFGVLVFLGPYIGPVVGAALAGPVVYVIGWLLHKYLISRVTGARVISAEAEGHYAQIILTLGIALVLANGGLILFGSTPLSVQTPLSRESWEIGLIFVNQARAVGFIMAVICAIGLYLFLTRTNLGKALRAAADNPTAAAYVGIDVDRSHRIAFGLGVGITAIAGGLFAMSQSFQPYIGFDFVIVMYAGVVLGGMGSILGSLVGAAVLVVLPQALTGMHEYEHMVLGLIVMACMIFLRQGIVPALAGALSGRSK
jgi:branched-chain amino acid transport system permease protein